MTQRLIQLFFIAFILCLFVYKEAFAQNDENSDLDLIPKTIESTKETKTSPDINSNLNGKAYIDDAVTAWVTRSSLYVPVPIQMPNWQNKTSIDINYKWLINDKTKFNLSDRLDDYFGNTIPFASNGSAGNDFREGYFSFEVLPMTYLEAGRINIKNGSALGYNPTDFFKTQTTLNIASLDPSQLKENRMGTVMIEGQRIWNNGSLTLAFAPKLQTETSPMTTTASFNPLFGQTNYTNRLLGQLSYDIGGLNPQALIFLDDIGTHIGASLSQVVSSNIVAYIEWAGVLEKDLADRAVTFAKNTAAMPNITPLARETSNGDFQNDLVVGSSWTSSFNMTINLEYHYHQAGLSGSDFRHWLLFGGKDSTQAKEFWFIRQYAQVEQEPLMQHEFFIRLDYPNVIQSRLNLNTIAFINPYDGSILSQTSLQWFLSRNLTLESYENLSLGSRNSEKGSLPWSMSTILRVVWYM